jgi:2-iminobutanoate/2-iminopropanoate deaminase
VRAQLPVMLLLILALPACQPSDDVVRKAVAEEMNRQTATAWISPTPVIGPYTPAVRAGRLLFVSGQIALDPETGALRSDDIATETRQVLDNIGRILRASGYDSSEVVSAVVYLTDIGNYAKMNLVYGGYFQEGRYPARTAVQVAALPKGANVEIAVVAYKQ